MGNRFLPGLIAVLLGLLVLGVYWPGLHGGFFFDDGPSILHVPGLRMTELSWATLEMAWVSGGAGPTGRPVAQLSFALNYWLSGYSPFSFKLSNLGIHLLCGLLVYGVVCELQDKRGESRPQPEGRSLALLVTALWLLHPLQLLPVLHVVQRMTSLSVLFLLAAFWLHILARRRGGLSGSWVLVVAWGLAWPLSVLSKETGLLFPLFVLIWELLLRRAEVGRLDLFGKIYAILSLLLVFCVVFYLLSPNSQWLWAGYTFRPFDWGQRLLTEARVLWFYVGLALFPRASGFALYHDDIAISSDAFTPLSTLPAVLGWMAVLWLIWQLRQRKPLIAFGLSWFLVGHLLESTVLPLEIAHEHRNYLPLLGLLLAMTTGVQAWASERIQPKVLASMAVLVVLICTGLTALRSYQYGEDLRRALTEVHNHPNSPRARYEVGMMLATLPMASEPGSLVYKTAYHHLARATDLDPNFKMALLEQLALDCKAGQGVPQERLEQLSRRLRTTLVAPGDRNVLYYVKEMAIAGQICLNRGQVVGLFQAALDNPQAGPVVRGMLYSWLADYLWLHGRDMVAAQEALARSLALNPGQASNRLKWAQLLWLAGDREGAHQLLLKLRASRLTVEERRTLEQLLTAGNIGSP